MIDEILDIIKDEVDAFLKLKMKDSRQQYVHLAPLVDLNGKPAMNENAILMTLFKIEEDRVNMSNNRESRLADDKVFYMNAPVKLNLFILVSAVYADAQEKNYLEALKRLSYVVGFFQAKNVFTARNTPRLDPAYGRIIMEIYNQLPEEQNNFWGMFGGLYRPSVVYRLRALMIQEEQVTSMAPPTMGTGAEVFQNKS